LNNRLVYFHDPMCSWCWAYRPTWLRLKAKLPGELSVEYVLGGLAPDSDQPMPEEMRTAIKGYWLQIQKQLGTEFNFEFWKKCKPRRDTYKACRALIVAKNKRLESEMLEAIQRAYYLRAMNPSEIDTLAQLATEIGMDEAAFRRHLLTAETEQQLQKEISLARHWQVQGFPSLVLAVGDKKYRLPIDYKNEQTTLQQLLAFLSPLI